MRWIAVQRIRGGKPAALCICAELERRRDRSHTRLRAVAQSLASSDQKVTRIVAAMRRSKVNQPLRYRCESTWSTL